MAKSVTTTFNGEVKVGQLNTGDSDNVATSPAPIFPSTKHTGLELRLQAKQAKDSGNLPEAARLYAQAALTTENVDRQNIYLELCQECDAELAKTIRKTVIQRRSDVEEMKKKGTRSKSDI